MKKIFIAIACFLCGSIAFALDDAAFLELAQKKIEMGAPFAVGETEEDGLYCIAIEEIVTLESRAAEASVETARLSALRKLTAYIHGETLSAETTTATESTTTVVDEKEIETFRESFASKSKSSVDAMMRGARVLGQVTYEDVPYIVLVVTESTTDESETLKAAMKEMGDDGVVRSLGESANRDEALQKALRGAVEQVLGTIVVGYNKASSDDEKDSFKQQMFAGTDGFVETYRILEEVTGPSGALRIQIVAKVSKKSLLDRYDNYMKFLGDPAFYIESNSADLASHFNQFFVNLGIRITEKRSEATYIIRCEGNFRDVAHPTNGRSGKQLSLRFRVSEIGSEEVLLDMKNNPKKSASFIGNDPDRQSEICAEKAFKQMKEPMHKKIHNMIARMVSRKMDAEAAEEE